MDNQDFNVGNFENIFNKDHKCRSLLYSNVKTPIQTTNTPLDVLKIVSLQMKAIQMADRVKGINDQKKSNVISDKLTANKKPILKKTGVNKFETQCVSDTQLIDVVKVAEAFEAEQGVTQDMDDSITVSDLEKIIEENNMRNRSISEGQRIEDRYQYFTANNNVNMNETGSGMEKTVIGFTEDFLEENIAHGNQIKVHGKDKDFMNTDTKSNTGNIVGLETTTLGFPEDFVQRDEDIFEDNDFAGIDHDFDALERNRCVSLSPILNKIEPISQSFPKKVSPERHHERSLSPVLGVNIVKRSRSQEPLVFNLHSFEKFEQVALPLVEENLDLKTVKHLINSQILDKELYLPSKVIDDIAPEDIPLRDVDTTLNMGETHKEIDDDKTSITDSIDFKLKDDRDKRSSTLEDEILFSSDEEIYEHKEIQDLPLTCALETSFYEQPNILDTTMYVGFQTASNKTIQVLTESFIKAKSILNELDTKKELPLTELVKICDSVAKTEQSKEKSTCQDNSNRSEKDVSIEIPDISISQLNKLTGIMTSKCVGNKPDTYTDLEECKKNDLIKEITQFPYIDVSMLNTNIDNVCQEDNIKMSHQNNNENVTESLVKLQPFNDNQGFKTASNKVIRLSNAALSTCQKVFHNINLDENFDEFCHSDVSKGSISSIRPEELLKVLKTDYNMNKDEIQADINDESIIQEFENIEMSVEDKIIQQIQHVDSESASNKNVRILDTSIDKAMHSLKGFKLDLNDNTHAKPLPKLTMEINNDDGSSKQIYKTLESDTNNYIGFRTAGNKNIKISDQAIAKTKNLFHDIELDDLVHTSEDTQDISKKNKPSESNIDYLVKSSSSTGFQTASNKKIIISNEALVKTKNIFKDIDKINDLNVSPEKSPLNIVGFQEANKKPVRLSVETLEKCRKVFQDENLNFRESICSYTENILPVSNNVRFKTNKKSAHIFAKPLERSKTIFEESKVDLKNKVFAEIPDQRKVFSGFQTASNKSVNISAEALERSNKIFQDENLESINKNICVSKPVRSEMNINVQAMKNKPLHIPKKTMERTKKIFQNLDNVECNHDLDKISLNEPQFGFKTASNNKVKISHEALANNAGLNDKSSELCSNSTNNTFKGFQTASKKNVKISKESLDKVKNIFQDIDLSIKFGKNYVTRGPHYDESQTEKVSDTVVNMCGFKTASNKPVPVSSESLARSKRLFDDIDDIQNIADIEKEHIHNSGTKNVYPIISGSKELLDNVNSGYTGFKTASNKKVNITDEALTKSKQIFQDIAVMEVNENTDKNIELIAPLAKVDHENIAKRFKSNDLHVDKNISIVKDVPERINKENIADIINTQVLNNFENTMYTEDFRDVSLRNKRSGSPILSCPSAKRRRFKTPYRDNPIITDSKIISDSVKCNEGTIFLKNYKKSKIYTLKDLISLRGVYDDAIDAYLTNFDFDTLLNIEFDGKRNDVTTYKMNMDSLKDTFLSSVNKKLVPNGWLDNHIKLILWKLISYEVRFHKLGVVCTVRNLVNQLKYRYDKELYNAERPALRKILEKDDVPSKTLVLCVAAILVDGIKVDNSATTTVDNVELLLTDGWYCVMACIDKMIIRLVRTNKIVVGSKIATNGAELLNAEQGVAPWEDTSSVRLKIFGNSTRRARWDARLGYHSNGAILSQLSHVKLDGGKVSKLRLFVARVYPALYVEKFEDGSTVTRSERLEHLHQIKYEADRQNILEKLYEEVEKEFSDQESQDSESICDNRKPGLQSGSQIFEAVKRSKDSSDFSNHLTSSQTKLLEAHNNKRREQLLEKVHAKLMDKIDRSGLRQGRNVVMVLKIRVVGLEERSGVAVTRGLLSIWKPNDALLDLIKEDSWIEVMNVVPTAVRYSEIQISAGRQSIFKQSKFKESDGMKTLIKSLKRKCYTIKELNIPQTTDYNEVDTAGMIFLIDPPVQNFDSKSQFQNVYLTDKDCNMICVNFWGGLQKFGFQNVLDTGQMVACMNLQKRAGNTRNVPQYRATEFTYFTKTPKNQRAKEIIDELNKTSLLDRRRICEECVKLKNNFPTKSNESVTPYKMDIELGKNKALLNSVEKIAHAELNLTGLDFESSFRQNDEELSPKTLKRKREVNNRINKLKMYGEPPPLSPIHMINKSKNAFNSYKNPLVNSDTSSGVARDKNIHIRKVENKITPVPKQNNINVATTTSHSKNDSKESPVTSLNKTYIKSSVNPVKLNFDNNTSDLDDQFAEEFDASPPLSLD